MQQDVNVLIDLARTDRTWFGNMYARFRRFIARLSGKTANRQGLYKLERMFAKAAKASNKAAQTQKKPTTTSGTQYRIENKKVAKSISKGYTNEYATKVSGWANEGNTKPGDMKVFLDTRKGSPENTWCLYEANGTGGCVLLARGSAEEVTAFYERVYAEKDRGIYTNLEIARGRKRSNLWDMQLSGNRGNDVGNAQSVGDEAIRSVAARSYEYLLPGYQRTLEQIESPNYDLEYLQAYQNRDIKTIARLVKEAARNAGFHHRGWHGSPHRFYTFDLSKGKVSPDPSQILGYGYYFYAESENAKSYARNGKVYDSFLKFNNPYITSVYGKALREEISRDILGETDIVVSTAEQNEVLKQNQYDGIVLLGEDGQARMMVAFYPNQIKSADPVTYDDDGNVIPLSQRFDRGKSDIRYSLPIQPVSDPMTEEGYAEEAARASMMGVDFTTVPPM